MESTPLLKLYKETVEKQQGTYHSNIHNMIIINPGGLTKSVNSEQSLHLKPAFPHLPLLLLCLTVWIVPIPLPERTSSSAFASCSFNHITYYSRNVIPFFRAAIGPKLS